MKFEDLLIGDFINVTIQGITHPIQVKTNQGNQIESTEDVAYTIKDDTKFDGIVLTPSILKKNGFKNTYPSTYELKIDDYTSVSVSYYNDNITVSTEFSYDNKSFDFYIMYVHELQHLLKLLKYDKPIKLITYGK